MRSGVAGAFWQPGNPFSIAAPDTGPNLASMPGQESSDFDGDFLLFCDGASRGNPGPAAAGGLWVDPNGGTVLEISRSLGRATNNVAEYQSLLLGLEELEAFLESEGRDTAETRIAIRMDSELVVKQIRGEYRVKNAALRPFYEKIIQRLQSFGAWNIKHVRRAQNSRADALANRALDR